jgi:hypothetical protein
LLQQEGDYGQSIITCDKGLVIFGNDPDLLYVKLLGQMKMEENRAAKATARELLKIMPQRRAELEQMFGGPL